MSAYATALSELNKTDLLNHALETYDKLSAAEAKVEELEARAVFDATARRYLDAELKRLRSDHDDNGKTKSALVDLVNRTSTRLGEALEALAASDKLLGEKTVELVETKAELAEAKRRLAGLDR